MDHWAIVVVMCSSSSWRQIEFHASAQTSPSFCGRVRNAKSAQEPLQIWHVHLKLQVMLELMKSWPLINTSRPRTPITLMWNRTSRITSHNAQVTNPSVHHEIAQPILNFCDKTVPGHCPDVCASYYVRSLLEDVLASMSISELSESGHKRIGVSIPEFGSPKNPSAMLRKIWVLLCGPSLVF